MRQDTRAAGTVSGAGAEAALSASVGDGTSIEARILESLGHAVIAADPSETIA